jgi:DNA processing protein
VKYLAEDGFAIVSGLAEGVDTYAHQTALALGGKTIAVIGTPLSHNYPKQNSELQRTIRNNYLLISQIPFQRYLEQDYRSNRIFFPERNITTSALTEATIIIEGA